MNRATMRAFLAAFTVLSAALAGPAEIGFVVGQGPGEKLTPESHTACELARKLVAARLLRPAGGGTFVDESRQPVAGDARFLQREVSQFRHAG